MNEKSVHAIDKEYFKTTPFERIDAGPLVHPDSKKYQQSIVNHSKNSECWTQYRRQLKLITYPTNRKYHFKNDSLEASCCE